MRMIYDLVDPGELIGYGRSAFQEIDENQWSLNRWFPTNTTEDLAYKVRQGALVDVDVAEYRSFDTPAPMTGRQGFSELRGDLPPVSRQFQIGEEELLRLRAMDAGSNDTLVDAIYNDTERAMRSIVGRLARAQGDLLVDGIVSLAENGLQLTADFQMPGTHQVTAAVAWTQANAATATPISDLLAWQEVLATDSNPASVLLLPRAKLAALAVNEEIRDYRSSNGTTPPRVTLDDIQDALATEGLPRIEVFDEKVRVDGVHTRLLPANMAFLMPEPGVGQLGETLYGVTAEAVELTTGGYIARRDAAGVVAVVAKQDHPVQTFTVGTAIALPLLGDPNAHISATIG